MVYKSGLQTHDSSDTTELIRIPALRSGGSNYSRVINGVHSKLPSRIADKSVHCRVVISTVDPKHVKSLEERRLSRLKDVETMEKEILKRTGVKVGVPRLRNISQLRESIFLDQSYTPTDKISKEATSVRSTRCDLTTIRSNESKGRTGRKISNSMLANLKDLERLSTTPPSQRNTNRFSYVEMQSKIQEKVPQKNSLLDSNTSKIQSDISRIQQMFQGSKLSKPVKNFRDQKSKIAEVHKTENMKKSAVSTVPNLIENSKTHQYMVQDHCINEKHSLEYKKIKYTKKANGNLTSVNQSHCIGSLKVDEANCAESNSDRPQPPVRKRRPSKYVIDRKDIDEVDTVESSHVSSNLQLTISNKGRKNEIESTGVKIDKEDEKSSQDVLGRPEFLDSLVKESAQQIENLKSDKSKSRNNWRGFVQSMRLHDVELHSDSEDQRKGKTHFHFFHLKTI